MPQGLVSVLQDSFSSKRSHLSPEPVADFEGLDSGNSANLMKRGIYPGMTEEQSSQFRKQLQDAFTQQMRRNLKKSREALKELKRALEGR